MFDKYLILEDSVRNTVTGFSIDVRLGYYRGLGLSMVEDIELTLGGEVVDRSAIRFDEGGGPLTLAEMAEAFDRRWEFGAPARLSVIRPGGIDPGEHLVGLIERLRISYLPFPLTAADAKLIEVR